MRMIDLGRWQSGLQIMDMSITSNGTRSTTAVSVECGREMRLRRSFRNLVECMVLPCCGIQPSASSSDDNKYRCSQFRDNDNDDDADDDQMMMSSYSTRPTSITTSQNQMMKVTGTFFGQRKGGRRLSFCLQQDTRRTGSPLLLLDLAVPTSFLAREMQSGLLRIALIESCSSSSSSSKYCNSLFQVPLWSMYCNGRKVGFAVGRQLSISDAALLKQMQSVSVGAGVLQDDLMYMRATFQRVIGSPDSESFHMINPTGDADDDIPHVTSSHLQAQHLSIFLLRSS